jgi:cell wall-associated NlpC family hydrolase
MFKRGRHTRWVRRGVLAVLVVALGIGALAYAAAGRDPAPRAVAATTEKKKSELPPLPDMRPKVVEPVAGNAGGTDAPVQDPGLTEVGPKPTAPASAGGRRQAVAIRRADPSKAVALGNGVALPPLDAPEEVKQIIEAGNVIARTPYLWGGGHGKWLDTGYDCSGSVSFALAAAGLLNGPLASGPLMSWGEAGPGKWVTIYANNGHVYMYVAGVRFDTSNSRVTGSRWSNTVRSNAGFVARHPAGL